ncbi:helix-turn-helix domain-containing protein [Ruegeria sp.]|uniref:helix-turn-helix domain-containing protein n=1 Tax=Ruegeria sp. TaxID=1879320 RepID=UPI003B00002C
MNRAEVLQEVRLMKFEDVYSRRSANKLTQEQAAEILGVSVRTVRRWEDRFEADGAEGLYDRRLGKLANNRVATDKVMEMLELFPDFRHFFV